MSDLNPTPHVDDLADLEDNRTSILVGSFNVKGATFIIPVDAPIPSEIAGDAMPVGSLYKRLAALDQDKPDSFQFVPLSGAELLSLERCWRMLVTSRRLYVLADLPAARYDVLFTQAVRQIGLQKVDWAHVSEALAAKVISDQRTKDAEPWLNPMIEGVEQRSTSRRRAPVSSTGSKSPLPVPVSYEDQP